MSLQKCWWTEGGQGEVIPSATSATLISDTNTADGTDLGH
jgi:hypothetical protein